MLVQNHRKKLTILSAITVFALVSVFGFSFVTNNTRNSGIGTTKASAQEPADINSDGKVDVFDLGMLLSKVNGA